MTLEYLAKQKEKYQDRSDYFAAIDFHNLANSFQGVVDLIGEMEEYIKVNQVAEKGITDEYDENLSE